MLIIIKQQQSLTIMKKNKKQEDILISRTIENNDYLSILTRINSIIAILSLSSSNTSSFSFANLKTQ